MAKLDAQKALQLSALLAMTAQQFTTSNPGQQALAQNLLGSAQAGIQAEALKKAKKEEEKKEKGLFGGKIGSLLGGAALAAIPGVGPVASAALGAAGGAAGGALGSALAGGTYSGTSALTDGLMGGMNAYQYGKSSQFAQPDTTNTYQPMSKLPPAVQQPMAPQVANPSGALPPAVQANPMVQGAPSLMSQGVSPVQASMITNAQQTKPMGFGQRFIGGVANALGIQQKPRVVRNPDGTVDYWG